jgi:hypothetical protein
LKNPVLEKLLDLLVRTADPVDATDRSSYERFALPYVFKPRLSFYEACVAVFAALARIFLGSLLFAIWGSYSLMVWTSIPGLFLRVSVLLPMLLVFLCSFILVMISITALARVVSQKHV